MNVLWTITGDFGQPIFLFQTADILGNAVSISWHDRWVFQLWYPCFSSLQPSRHACPQVLQCLDLYWEPLSWPSIDMAIRVDDTLVPAKKIEERLEISTATTTLREECCRRPARYNHACGKQATQRISLVSNDGATRPQAHAI